MEKQKVLFLTPSLHGGGAERVIVTLLKHIDRSKFHLALAVVDARDAVFRDDLPPDIEFVDLGVTRVRYALPRIIGLIWKRRPDVVFSTLGHLNLALSMIRSLLPDGLRYIARETIVVSKLLESYSYPCIWRRLYRRFYKRHDLLVCQSQDMKSDLVKDFCFPTEQTVVINNPVDVQYIKTQAALPLDCSWPDVDCIRLIAVGRLTKQKGFDLLIDAIALLNNPKIHLCILGEGILLDELKQFALTKGVSEQVEFVGFQTNPYAWFAQADAFVLSSHYEGFPNVVLEALACGVPIIATPAPGGIHEILNNISGCIIAEEISASGLANAIGRWLSTREQIPDSAIEPYRVERIVAQYESLFLHEVNNCNESLG